MENKIIIDSITVRRISNTCEQGPQGETGPIAHATIIKIG